MIRDEYLLGQSQALVTSVTIMNSDLHIKPILFVIAKNFFLREI